MMGGVGRGKSSLGMGHLSNDSESHAGSRGEAVPGRANGVRVGTPPEDTWTISRSIFDCHKNDISFFFSCQDESKRTLTHLKRLTIIPKDPGGLKGDDRMKDIGLAYQGTRISLTHYVFWDNFCHLLGPYFLSWLLTNTSPSLLHTWIPMVGWCFFIKYGTLGDQTQAPNHERCKFVEAQSSQISQCSIRIIQRRQSLVVSLPCSPSGCISKTDAWMFRSFPLLPHSSSLVLTGVSEVT